MPIKSKYQPKLMHAQSDVIITRRDYFASAALAGLLSQDDERHCPHSRMEDVEAWRAEARAADAKYCVQMADALIQALGKGKEKSSET